MKNIIITISLILISICIFLEWTSSSNIPQVILYLSNVKQFIILVPLFILVLMINSPLLKILFISIGLFFHFEVVNFLLNDSQCSNYEANKSESITLTLGTLNVAGNRNLNYKMLRNFIQKNNIDIIGFQEVSPSFLKSEFVKDLLNNYYSHYNFNEENYWTQLTLSRFKIKSSIKFDPGEGFTSKDARISIISELDLNGHKVYVINNHTSIPFIRDISCRGIECLFFNYDQTKRDLQLINLKEKIESLNEATIALGDFNLSDQNYSYKIFSENLIDSNRCNLLPKYTWPSDMLFPFIRIDYVFLKNNRKIKFYPFESNIFFIDGTDHFGYISKIRIEIE